MKHSTLTTCRAFARRRRGRAVRRSGRSALQAAPLGQRLAWIAAAAAGLLVGGSAGPAGRAEDRLAAADQLRLTGRYAEAAAAYRRVAKDRPIAAAVGRARCQWAVGRTDEAEQTLRAAARNHRQAAALRAELAQWALRRGRYDAAQKHADAALAADENQLAARWVSAELHRLAGRLDEANRAYRWLVRFYNEHPQAVGSADDLRWIGLAAAQFARWNRNSSEFRFLVNRLYPRALEIDKHFWPAHLEAARLFLEKYNEADAAAELDAALAINPNAAPVHAARAMLALQRSDLDGAKASIARALEIHPHLIEAHQAWADWLMANFRVKDAAAALEEARQFCPVQEETLGRLAAAYGAIDGLRDEGAATRMGRIIQAAVQRNEHCGRFFFSLAATLERLRKFPQAAKYYAEAQRRMPQLVGVRGRLGLMYMRLGDEAKAARLLDESFQIDPFNVRVKNMLAVLDRIDRYEAIETDHFLIKFDPARDRLLAQYAARYLEEQVYPELVSLLGYRPQAKTLLEIFSRSGRTSGHGWFSARMVGLPYIGTVGACAGKMVAMVSPGDMPRPFNWARVLKHELVHVVNLQQTDFNIPHWFTEALAVTHEGTARPGSWDEVLVRRAAEGKLFNLQSINLGFLRPGGGDDWTLAYCQAWLYARYMADTFGPDALADMLDAYADNLPTRDAIQRCFDLTLEQFEAGYRTYLNRFVENLDVGAAEAERSFAELQRAVQQNPRDADLLAELAYQYLQRGANPQARRLALEAKSLEKKNQLAAYVLARLQVSIGATEQALALLEASLDEKAPQPNALALLAGLKFRAEDYPEAARLYRLGARHYPRQDKWLRWLARVYLASNKEAKLAGVLGELARRDVDNLVLRKKLAQLALDRGDVAEAARWANQAVHIDVMDAEVHALLGQALDRLGRLRRAIGEYEIAVQLQPDRLAWRLALAQVCRRAGQTGKAQAVLDQLLKIAPDDPGAKELRENLQP